MARRPALSTLLLLLALTLLGLAAGLLAAASVQGFAAYQPPLADGPAPGRTGAPLADQVVLVVVDGLRYDTSLQMPFLNELRHQGADYVAEATLPSLSLPGWTALVSGAGPEISGVTSNWHAGPARVDNLFAAARRAGRRTAVVGAAGWGRLFGEAIDVGRYTYDPAAGPPGGERVIPAPRDFWDEAGLTAADEAVAREALALLQTGQTGQTGQGEQAGPPALLVVHFLGPDEAGHAAGAASRAYAAAVARVDGLLRQLAGGLDLRSAALVVTADHGHLDRGGHGGGEPEVLRTPLVLAGQGIARPRLPGRAPPVVQQRDVAPTLAVLLGTSLPAQSQGAPLFPSLALPAAARASRAVDAAFQRRAFALAYARELGVEPPGGELAWTASDALAARFLAQAAADADDAVARLARWEAAAREERLVRDRTARAPLALAVGLLPLAYAVLARPRRETALARSAPRGPELPLGVAVGLAFWALYHWRGYGLSPSTLGPDASLTAFGLGRLADAAAPLLLLGVAVGLARRGAGPLDAARLTARAAYWGALLLVWQVAAFYALFGLTYRAYLPDTSLGLKYYLDLIQLVGLGLAAAPAAGLAALATRTRRLRSS